MMGVVTATRPLLSDTARGGEFRHLVAVGAATYGGVLFCCFRGLASGGAEDFPARRIAGHGNAARSGPVAREEPGLGETVVDALRRISVVVPTYNASARLRRTIGSVLAQTVPPHEIIIVDDGSTDDTARVCASFGNAIVYLAVENGGQQRARNIGVGRATGEWIAFLDHDDLWEPDYLAEIQAFQAGHAFDLAFCDSRTSREREDGTVI